MASRAAATPAIGAVAATSPSWSPIWTAASTTQATGGTHQRAYRPSCMGGTCPPSPLGPGSSGEARSRSRNSARIGTAVPAWLGSWRKTSVPPSTLGASMIAPATSARTRPSRPFAWPLASIAASSTVSV